MCKDLAVSLSRRNNDLLGYWAIGQLYKYCENTNKSELSFCLFSNEEASYFHEYRDILAQKVEGHLKKCGIPKKWIGSCIVTYKFNAEYIRKYHYWGSALGTHFLCSITIETDLGKQYTSLSGGNCWAHDPKKEQRRRGF